MAWDQLTVNRPHLAYIILGGFTSLFMLVSLFVKQRLYIGEATVATICGVIFGPHAAGWFNPTEWGNVDQITLECSRIVLVVQCFAVGVELPRAYMNRHWKSVVLLLVPVMAFGWMVTSLFIWWLIEPLTWLDSLCIAACVTATDPVLASSVVGKGKFAKRVPKHLRDLLSAESGCNDGMAFPFVYLAIYLLEYRPSGGKVIFHWAVIVVLYECVFGAIYGFVVGYAGRHAIRWAERHDLVDRESFLVFYFVLALFCAGTGSTLGLDDLLVGFAAGVGFSNDGWFQEKTEESHVSNVIDLLLNLAYFVYFGAIIPWDQFNSPDLGITPWRLVVIAILVILFRRIPIMVLLKPIISDIKTWREALFAGHFGPIGVGAIFVAILAKAELQDHSPTPSGEPPESGTKHYMVIRAIWPITTFLVISSILIHGSSIAVFTLGKRINTLTITMSYTQANEDGPSWMNRLPRIQSQARGSMSIRKPDLDSDSSNEKLPEYPPGTLPPLGFPSHFLQRQAEEESHNTHGSRTSSVLPPLRRKKRELEIGPGGPISQSAITPQRRTETPTDSPVEMSVTREKSEPPTEKSQDVEISTFQEGDNIIVEDQEGNVLNEEELQDGPSIQEKGKHIVEEAKEAVHPKRPIQNFTKRFTSRDWSRQSKAESSRPPPGPRRGPAHAYQFGNTIIVEDEDGEVVKKYSIPDPKKTSTDQGAGFPSSGDPSQKQKLQRMGTWVGLGRKESERRDKLRPDDDERVRFVSGGRRMSKADFIQQIQQLDPNAQAEISKAIQPSQKTNPSAGEPSRSVTGGQTDEERGRSYFTSTAPQDEGLQSLEKSTSTESNQEGIPQHPVGDDLARYSRGTAAQRRREQAMMAEEDSDDDGTERVPPSSGKSPAKPFAARQTAGGQAETAAERRRREAALGMAGDETDSDEDDEPRQHGRAVPEPGRIRFVDQPAQRRTRPDEWQRR